MREHLVLYIDDSPLLLSDIKRNVRGKIISGHVENGNWHLKLSNTVLYAFQRFRDQYGWGNELLLKNERPYKKYEEVLVERGLQFPTSGERHLTYNDIIMMADQKRE